ncbi:hypothetical protein [Clostridium facile]|uniref:Uncharacterized protein n=1 Tax=Clostridium facile TaxID=2763035 RepID=A0ABR7IPA6_9CLOT|nr:hypothetical protein [Clostridium facile]MBC5786918.1 hypothetical protein [Clostridium facile]
MANDIDFKALEKEIKNATNETKNFTKELKNVINELSSVGSSGGGFSINGLASTISDLETISDSIEESYESVNKLSGGFSGLGGAIFSGIGTIIGGFSSLTGAISLVTSAVSYLGNAYSEMKQEMIQKDIEDHFGNVTLSMEQLTEAAETLTNADWNIRINTVLNAQEETNNLKQDIDQTIADIEQYNWKVKVGITLTEEDKQNYQKSISDYVTSTTEYLNKQWYTTNLAINLLFKPGSESSTFANSASASVFGGLYTQISQLSADLNKTVADAIETDTLNTPDVQNAIQTKIQQMQEIINQVSDAQYQVKVDQIEAKIESGSLTQESFSGLQEELNTSLAEKTSEIDNLTASALVAFQLQLQNKQISPDEYDRIKKSFELEASRNITTITLDTVNLEIKGFKTIWNSELSNLSSNLEKHVAQQIKIFDFQGGTTDINESTIASILNVGDLGSLEEPLTNFVDSVQEKKLTLEKQVQEYQELGQSIPSSILDTLGEIYKYEALLGDPNGGFSYLAQQIVSNQEAFQQFKDFIKNFPEKFPDEFIDQLELFSGETFTGKNWVKKLVASDESIEEVKAKLQEQGIELSDAVIESLATVTPSVQQKAIELANAYTLSDNEEEKQNLLLQLAQLGVTMDDALAQGIYQNMGFVRLAGSDTITAFNTATGEEIGTVTPQFVQNLSNMGLTGLFGMQQVIDGNPLNAPSLKDINAKAWADHNYALIQTEMNGKTVHIKIAGDKVLYGSVNGPDGKPLFYTYGKPKGFATGGFVDKEQLSWIAEGDKPEVVIPLDPGKRTRAMQLFAQTSELLGVSVQARNGFPLGDSLSPSTSVVDYSRLAALITDSLKSSAIQCNPVFQVSQGDVYLDSEKAGRALTPVISRIQAKTAKFETR